MTIKNEYRRCTKCGNLFKNYVNPDACPRCDVNLVDKKKSKKLKINPDQKN